MYDVGRTIQISFISLHSGGIRNVFTPFSTCLNTNPMYRLSEVQVVILSAGLPHLCSRVYTSLLPRFVRQALQTRQSLLLTFSKRFLTFFFFLKFTSTFQRPYIVLYLVIPVFFQSVFSQFFCQFLTAYNPSFCLNCSDRIIHNNPLKSRYNPETKTLSVICLGLFLYHVKWWVFRQSELLSVAEFISSPGLIFYCLFPLPPCRNRVGIDFEIR